MADLLTAKLDQSAEEALKSLKVGKYGRLPNVYGCEHANEDQLTRSCPTCGKSQTPIHSQGASLLGGPCTHVMLYGGSRSGKTFTICRQIIIRALCSPGSTHAIMRKTFNDLRRSIVEQTMPAVLSKCFSPTFADAVRLNQTGWYYELPNGSKIFLGGLADNKQTEKILGQEHATIFLNECSQISYSARIKALSRLAQKAFVYYPGHPMHGGQLRLKMFYDQNPPNTMHWTHDLFEKGIEPEGRNRLKDGFKYTKMRINPMDNLPNLPQEYLDQLDAMPDSQRLRWLLGEYTPAVVGALWMQDRIQRETQPQTDAEFERLISRMRRIVVAVDPSGCEGPEDTRSDEIGIVVCGIDGGGIGHVLDDVTGHYSPEGWSHAAVEMYDKWDADCIIGEVNYGGDMVRAAIHSARSSVPFKKITASRGKHIRAEPVSAMYGVRNNRVKHVGHFPDLEMELCNFSAAGYQGERSPNRADAAIFALTDLMIDTRRGQAGQGVVIGGN